MESGTGLLSTDIDAILHVTKVTSGLDQIDFSGSGPQTIGVVFWQHPDSCKFSKSLHLPRFYINVLNCFYKFIPLKLLYDQ